MIQPKLEPEYNFIYNQWGFRLLDDYTFQSSGGGAYTIPYGFWYNAGSIPALFWQLTYSPYDPILLLPTLIHDWPYLSHVIPRDEADQTLHDYAEKLGASHIKIGMIKKAVSLFGEKYYENDDIDRNYLYMLKKEIQDSGRSLTQYGLSS